MVPFRLPKLNDAYASLLVNFGGKIFLPPSALEKLTRLHIEYPMNFELINGAAEKTTHAGVLEFVAEEGKVYLPPWVSSDIIYRSYTYH